jgi:leader peptidase (prepilin peptidase) / N-methyltransferase
MISIRHSDFIFGRLPGIAAAVASMWLVPCTSGFFGAGLALLMVAIAVADFRHLIIPNELTVVALALALLNAAIADASSGFEGVANAILRGSATMLLFVALRTI